MRPTWKLFRKIDPEDLKTAAFFLLLFAAVTLSFSFFIGSVDQSKNPVAQGVVQETSGYWIGVLGRFDQERQARLQEQWNKTVQHFTTFQNGRQARLQEILGQSIAHTARTIWMEQERLKAAVIQARKELQERPARWQEKLGMAVVTAYRRAPKGGDAFLAAFQRETNRLKKIEERTSHRLESNLNSLTAQQAEFHDAIPAMYREAISSARRSVEMLEASQMAWAGRIFDELRTDLSWKREPEDYVNLVGSVREILKGNNVASGFVEYGLSALAGLILAMVWVGFTVTKDRYPTP